MLYTAKCYWPGVTVEELAQVASRALRATTQIPPGKNRPSYLGSIVFPADELVLCLFAADSSAAVKGASAEARIPCERVIETLWLAPAGCSEVEPLLRDTRRT